MAFESAPFCSRCGKAFDMWDEMENFAIDHHFGYGTRHDLQHMKIRLCCACADELADRMIDECMLDVMDDYDVVGSVKEPNPDDMEVITDAEETR